MELKAKTLKIVIVIVTLLALCAGTAAYALFSHNAAYAQPNIEGTCHVKWRGEGVYDNVFYVTMPDQITYIGYCMDTGLPAAAEYDYPFTGTWNGGGYDIVVDATGGEVDSRQFDTGAGCQRVGNFTWTPKGAIELTKASLIPSLSDDNDCYSVANAQYGVYQDPNCTQCITTLTTDSAGYARAENILVGTYYVQETTAPAGYAIDTAVYAIDVQLGQTTQVNGGTIYDVPQSAEVSLALQKVDAETRTAESIGGNTLEGSLFSLRYYDSIFQNAEEAIASGNPLRTWTLSTTSTGALSLTSESLVEGDSFYTNSNGHICLPVGSVVFQEIQAPAGYVLDSTPILVTLSSTGTQENDVAFATPIVANQAIRGDIEFVKANENTQQRLSGIPFKITNLSTGEAHIIVTDENGYASSAASFNPHSLRTNANDALYEQMKSEHDAQTATESSSGDESSTDNLSDALSSTTTSVDAPSSEGSGDDGEDILILESEGKSLETLNATTTSFEGSVNALSYESTDASTSSDSPSDQSTTVPTSAENANLNNASSNAETHSTTLDLRCGVWFGALDSEGTLSPIDSLGALPYGCYSIEELSCEANDGLELISLPSITISRNNYMVNLGTFDNQAKPDSSPEPEPEPEPEATPTPTPAPSSTPDVTPTPTPLAKAQDKTGVNLNGLASCLVLISLLGCGMIAYGLHRCKKARLHK